MISNAVAAHLADLNPALPAVLVGHVSMQGASLGFEQSIMLGRDVTVGLDDLHARAFDYVALGHIHKHQVVGGRPPAVYAGSPERIDFGEEHESKGFVLVTIDGSGADRTTTWTFEPLPSRPFRTLRIDARGGDPMAIVRRDVERLGSDVSGAIVRCYVEVDPGRERGVNAQEVRRVLLELGAAFVAHVVVESVTETRAREAIAEESARDSMRMLERWVEGRTYDPELKQRVLTRGRDLIDLRSLSTPRRRGEERG
jgi:exonuclease SbcD